MVQTATNTFYNREQKKEAKAREKERKKETSHAQMLAALQGSPIANPKSLKDKAPIPFITESRRRRPRPRRRR